MVLDLLHHTTNRLQPWVQAGWGPRGSQLRLGRAGRCPLV